MHLVELEDLPWVPAAVRDGGTDFLDFMTARTRLYAEAVDALVAVLDATGSRSLVDLCSGGGGGTLALRDELRRRGRDDVDLTLTDRYPSASARARVEALRDARVRYRDEPLDVLGPQPALAGVRTMSGALHHFRPEEIQVILQRIVDAGHAVAVFDVAASPMLRKVPTPLVPLLALPNMVALAVATLVTAPLLRPVRASRLALTYGLPLVPALVAFDGTVSAIRAYEPDELLAITARLAGTERYQWRAARAGRALYLTGTPR